MVDALFALAVLAFILVTAWVSITGFVHAPSAGVESAASRLLGGRLRGWYVAHLKPFEERCVQHGVRPSHLSVAQLVASVLVAWCYATGLLFTAGWLLMITGSFDIIDGRIARRTNSGSKQGAFLDSVVDRYADSFSFLGLAVYFRDSWVLWAALFALSGGLLVSYTRARAEGLGTDCKIGLLQRPERYVILGFGSLFGTLFDRLAAPWVDPDRHLLFAGVIVLLAILVNFTAVQRAVYVWRALGERPHGAV
jgi:CDP-diacylglycerol--glycerol-3-phosphate 3-phosphatidyltransferase